MTESAALAPAITPVPLEIKESPVVTLKAVD